MPGAPPILPPPRGTPRGPTASVPLRASPPREPSLAGLRGSSGPSRPTRVIPYGVRAPSPRVSKPSGPFSQKYTPPPNLFSRPLSSATRENIRTGAGFQIYRAQHPNMIVHERVKVPNLFGFGSHYENRATRARETVAQEEARLPRSVGVVIPGAAGLAKAFVAGQVLQQVAPGSKGLYGKLYHEGTSLLTEAPRGTVELAKNPAAGIKSIKEVFTHPGSHPLFAATLGWGAVHGADMIAGRIAGAPPRAPGVTGVQGSRLQYSRDYSGALSIRTAQKAIENFKNKQGALPGTDPVKSYQAMKVAQRDYINSTPGTPKQHEAAQAMQAAEAAHLATLQGGKVMPSQVASTRNLPLFGSRLRKAVVGGGATAVGKVDIWHSAGKAIADMRAARFAEFLEEHRPSNVLDIKGKNEAAAHDAVITPMLEGYARNPDTFFEDIANREARLKEEHSRLTDPTAKQRNEMLQQQLTLIKDHRTAIEPHLSTHEQLTRLIAEVQDHLFNREMLSGHLHPDQWNARLFPFGLEHGDLLAHMFPDKYANGSLRYVPQEKTPKSDLQTNLEQAQKELKDAEGARRDAEVKLSEAKGYAKGKKAGLPRGVRHQVSVAEHHRDLLDERKALEMDARAHVKELRENLHHDIATGQLHSSGKPWHGLYDSAGTRVDSADLKALFERETNGRLPGFISHKDIELPVEKGAWKAAATLPGAPTRSRTGEHFLEGNYESHFGALHREFNKSARNLSAYQTKNQLMEEFGSHFVGNKDAMVQLARELNARDDPHSIAVRKALGPLIVVSRGPDRILNAQGMVEDSHHLQIAAGKAEGKALTEAALKEQKFTLIHERILQRIDEHQEALKPQGKIQRGLKRMTSYNRHVALYSSPRWPVGLHQEYAIRLAAINTNPLVVLGKHLSELSAAYKAGRGLLPGFLEIAGNDLRSTALDPTATVAEKITARQSAALMDHGAMIGNEVHDLIQRGGGLPHGLLDERRDWAEPIATAKGVKQGLRAWGWWKEKLGSELSRMETRVNMAHVGHQMIREYGRFSDQVKGLIKQEDNVVKQVAKDHLSPVARDKLAEGLIRDVGNWGHMTPFETELRSFWAPFAMWWLNSVKFVFRTMPMEHPLKTALWTAMVAASPPTQLPEYKAGSIRVTIPGIGPVDMNILHYSPFGIGQEWRNTATSMVMPWPVEAYERSRGIDPLYNSAIYSKEQAEGPSAGQSVLATAEQAAGSFVPGATQIASVIRGGAPPSQKGLFPLVEGKPGYKTNELAALAKAVFPYPYTKAAATKAKGGGPFSTPAFKTPGFKSPAFKSPAFKG